MPNSGARRGLDHLSTVDPMTNTPEVCTPRKVYLLPRGLLVLKARDFGQVVACFPHAPAGSRASRSGQP